MAAPPPKSPPTAPSSLTPWQWHLSETYKGLITLSVEALKMLALVNGGAAVAVLTYLGSLVSRAPVAHQPEIKPALLWYCGGLLATLMAFLFAYVTQLRLYNEEKARHELRPIRTIHTVGIIFAWLLALFSAVAFGVGCWSAATALAG